MHENILNTILFYCTNELKSFRESDFFKEISTLVDILEFSIETSFDRGIDEKENKYPQIIYLDISIVNKQGEIVLVDTLDYEHLSYATKIVSVDKKDRIQFFSWEEDADFIETIDWIKKELQKKVKPI